MAVKLRLRRTGARNQPRYRIVAADARSPRDGRFIEVIGHYDPTRQPHQVVVNAELAQKWLKRGAQPTDTVRALLAQEGLVERIARVPQERAAGSAPAPQESAGAPQEAAVPEPESLAAPEPESAAASQPQSPAASAETAAQAEQSQESGDSETLA
jgi:small subunit ribosomal protein S16